jgi:hypothetical protein
MKKLVILVVGCVALGLMLWLGLRSKTGPAEPMSDTPEAPAQSLVATLETNRLARVFTRSAHHHERAPVEATASTNAVSEWDAKIDEILASDAPESEIGKKLLELYPTVPPEGQADLALEIAARTANQDYGKLANIITNTTTTGEVVDVLLNDLLDRPDNLRLPLLLDMARSKGNAKSEDAHDLLEALLGEDYGEDWSQWSKKISEWLASHPE